MKITIWGCRGSIPSPGPETTFYGGNTSCVSMETDESFIVLDAGSGIRRLGMELANKPRIDIFLTHLHLDHIQGLGFFAPLYDLDAEIHIWGCASLTESLRSRLTRYLSLLSFQSEFGISKANSLFMKLEERDLCSMTCRWFQTTFLILVRL